VLKMKKPESGNGLAVPFAATEIAAPATAAASLEAASAASAAKTAAALARFAFLSFANAQGPALKIALIEGFNSTFGFFTIRHFDKTESTGPSRLAIFKHAGRFNTAILGENFVQFFVFNGVGEITNIDIHYTIYVV